MSLPIIKYYLTVDDCQRFFMHKMDAMINKIKPSAILVYGGMLDYDYKGIEVHYYDNKVTERMKLQKTLENKKLIDYNK